MGWAQLLEALGAALAPILREVIPVIWDILRQPDDAIHIESTPEQDEVTDAINNEWDAALEEYDLPPDYRDAFGLRPAD